MEHNMNDFSKRIVVDFDDTLCFHNGHSFETALPNKSLIDKLNEMISAGFFVDVYTARGSLSCSSREEADKKYRAQIEAWLEKYFPLFNLLSFDKPLAIAYIDDKAYLPNDFSNMTTGPLVGGYSGSSIYRMGDTVVKHDINAKKTAEWMKRFNSNGLTTPKVISVIDDTLVMEFINGVTLTEVLNAEYGEYDIINITEKVLSSNAVLATKTKPKKNEPFSYASRIQDHVNNMYTSRKITTGTPKLTSVIVDILNDMVETEHHGDLSTDNLLVTNTHIVHIDPIIIDDMWYNFVLDIAKLAATALLYTSVNDSFVKFVYTKSAVYDIDISFEDFKTLIACELARTYKYRKTIAEKNLVYNLFLNYSGISK